MSLTRVSMALMLPAALSLWACSRGPEFIARDEPCRAVNHVPGARLSEHGHANAVDISAFVLADGRVVQVKSGWWGAMAERTFLRAVHAGACNVFTTVLGPAYD